MRESEGGGGRGGGRESELRVTDVLSLGLFFQLLVEREPQILCFNFQLSLKSTDKDFGAFLKKLF